MLVIIIYCSKGNNAKNIMASAVPEAFGFPSVLDLG